MGSNSLGNVSWQDNRRQQGSTWYFYSPTAVQQGKITFQQLWGKRENIDNWQRINQGVVGRIGDMKTPVELTDQQRDSILQAEARQDSIDNARDSLKNDPHKREYYLAQIPFTPAQLEASNKILEDGLHHSGVIFKDRLDNLRLSEKALRRVSDDYPDYEQMDETAVQYKEDAEFFHRTAKGSTKSSEELLSSVRNMNQSMDEIGRATHESADGNTRIAENIVGMAERYADILEKVQGFKEGTERLKNLVTAFSK